MASKSLKRFRGRLILAMVRFVKGETYAGFLEFSFGGWGGEARAKYGRPSTATAKCAAFGRDEGSFVREGRTSKAKATAHPCGMTNKRTSKDNGKGRGSHFVDG
jgi:hypothetical protein